MEKVENRFKMLGWFSQHCNVASCFLWEEPVHGNFVEPGVIAEDVWRSPDWLDELRYKGMRPVKSVAFSQCWYGEQQIPAIAITV